MDTVLCTGNTALAVSCPLRAEESATKMAPTPGSYPTATLPWRRPAMTGGDQGLPYERLGQRPGPPTGAWTVGAGRPVAVRACREAIAYGTDSG
jgi:hypothetical protein